MALTYFISETVHCAMRFVESRVGGMNCIMQQEGTLHHQLSTTCVCVSFPQAVRIKLVMSHWSVSIWSVRVREEAVGSLWGNALSLSQVVSQNIEKHQGPYLCSLSFYISPSTSKSNSLQHTLWFLFLDKIADARRYPVSRWSWATGPRVGFRVSSRLLGLPLKGKKCSV